MNEKFMNKTLNGSSRSLFSRENLRRLQQKKP
jgi:hypothetical protein